MNKESADFYLCSFLDHFRSISNILTDAIGKKQEMQLEWFVMLLHLAYYNRISFSENKMSIESTRLYIDTRKHLHV